MIKRHLSISITFFTIVFLNLFAEYIGSVGLRYAAKPLICISLMVYLVRSTGLKGKYTKLIFGGLIMSLIGDVLLLNADKAVIWFLGGLISFLLAHICYSAAFFRDFQKNPTESKTFGWIMLFVMGVFSMSYYSYLRDYLNDFRLPVLAYVFVISVMAILAGYRYKRVKPISFILVLIGAILFVASDAILAYAKFVHPFEHSGAAIMLTYMAAQYLITIGSVERLNRMF